MRYYSIDWKETYNTMVNKELITIVGNTDGLIVRGNKIKAEVRIRNPKFSKGKSFNLTMDGYHEATKWRAELIDRVKNGKPIKEATSITIKQAVELTDKDPDVGWSNSSSNWCQIGFQKALMAVDFFKPNTLLEDIDLKKIKEYKTHLKSLEKGRDNKTLKESTINKYLDALNKVFKLADELGKFSSNPAIRPPKITKLNHDSSESAHRGFIFDSEQGINEEKDFYEVCNTFGSKFIELKKLIRIGVLTGMRCMEILTLKCMDVNLSRKTIRIKSTNTKSKKSRTIAFDDECKQLLKYFMGSRVGNQLVIVSKYDAFLERDKKKKTTLGKHVWNNSKIDRYFARVKKQLGIADPDLTFHSSRNTFILRGLESGKKPYIMQQIVGHSNIETTMGYVSKQLRLVSDSELKTYKHEANSANVGL